MKKQKGQATVETALMLVFVILGIVVLVADGFPFFLNHILAKEGSARGARAAAIFTADGSGRSCESDVIDAVGQLTFLSATWELELSPNCTSDAFATMLPGDEVWVTVRATYTPPFFGGFGWPPPEAKNSLNIVQTTVDHTR